MGPKPSHFSSITGGAPGAGEGPRGVWPKVLSGSCQLNSPATHLPPRRFRGPFQGSHGALLSLSAPEESKVPQLPMAAAPGEASSHLATDGEGYPRLKTSPRFDILNTGKGQKGRKTKGLWDMNFDAPPSLVTWPGVCSIRLFSPAPGAGLLRNKSCASACVRVAKREACVERAAGGNASRSVLSTSSEVVGDAETLVNLPSNLFGARTMCRELRWWTLEVRE